EGPPTMEFGEFVTLPEKAPRVFSATSFRAGSDQLPGSSSETTPNPFAAWEVLEDHKPPEVWRIEGTDMVNGSRCLKLVGVQQSDEWEHPRADRGAWRRRDDIWLAPKLGVAVKVERIIEKREPAHQDVSQRLVVQYELQDNM